MPGHRDPCENCGNTEYAEYWGPNCAATTYCHNEVVKIEQERDGWERRAEAALALTQIETSRAYVASLKNIQLRKALEEFRNDTPDAWMLVEKALALTVSKAEKILAAMEALASAVEAGLPSEFGDWAWVELDLVRDRLAALDAARKGDA